MSVIAHNCRSLLCDTPHYAYDDHKDDCCCIGCHDALEHDWRNWNVYPECQYCEMEMLEYWDNELEAA